MSMSSDSENFEQLRRLMALKRHEQPPPGYFHHFSRGVIVRIKAGEMGDQVTASWWSWDGSWLQRAWASIETRPALAGAFGVAFCGFFAAGALFSNADATIASIEPLPLPGSPVHLGDPRNAIAVDHSGIGDLQPVRYSLFEEIQRFQRQQSAPQAFNVNFVPGN